MEENFFDQFDTDEDNFFDQFDDAPVESERHMLPGTPEGEEYFANQEARQNGFNISPDGTVSILPPQAVEEPQERNTWSFEGTGLEKGIPESFQDFVGGAANAPRNVAETVLSLRDVIAGTDSASDFSEWADTNLPTYESPRDTISSEIFQGAGEFTVGGGAAAKVTKGILRGLGIEAGGVAAMDPSTESLTEPLRLIGLDENGNYSEELATRKLNLLVEGLAISKGLELGARGGAAVGALARDYIYQPLKTLGDTSKIEDAVTKDILNSLVDISPDDTPDVVAQKWQKIVDHVDNGSLGEMPSGVQGVDDLSVQRDTMSALQKGTDDPELIARARGLRAGLEGKGSPALEVALSKPSFEGDRFLTQSQEAFGGEEAIGRTREGIQENVFDQMRNLDMEEDRLVRGVSESEKSIEELIANDITIGKTLEDLGNEVNLDFRSTVQKKANDMVADIQKASDIMTQKKNDLYNAIPEGTQINIEAYNDAIEAVQDILPDKLRAQFGEAGVDFKELNRLVNFNDFTKLMNDMKGRQDWEGLSRLREFKSAISDDQLDYIMLSGNQEARDAAAEAKRYFIEEYAPYWRNNPTLSDIQQYSREYRFSPDERAYESRKSLTGTLRDPEQTEYTQRIAELLKRPEAGANVKQLADYALGEIAMDAQGILNAKGKLEADDIIGLSKKIERFVPLFKSVDETQVGRFNTFLTQLRNKKFTTEELQKNLEAFRKTSEKAKQDLTKGPLKDFFEDSFTPRTNDPAIFKDVFDNPEVLRDLPEVIKAAGPDGMPGLRAAYMDRLKSKLFRPQEGLAGEQLVSTLAKSEKDQLFKVGDELFKDTPEVMQAVRFITEEMMDARAGTVRRMPTFDISTFRKQASGTVDFVITQMFGALNRWGARLRSGAGRALSAIDPQDQVVTIMDTIMSNPEEFSKIAKRVISDNKSKEPLLSPQVRKDLYKLVVTSGVYGPRRENPQDEEDFINAFDQFDEDIDTEMLQLFGE